VKTVRVGTNDNLMHSNLLALEGWPLSLVLTGGRRFRIWYESPFVLATRSRTEKAFL